MVEELSGSHNWQAFFEPLRVNINGLTSTHTEPETNHSWRIVRRMDLDSYKKSTDMGNEWQVETNQD